MNLKTIIRFELVASRGISADDIRDVADIKTHINKNIGLFDLPNYIEVFRHVYIVDLDEPEKDRKFGSRYFNGYHQVAGFYHSDKFEFVFPVMYPDDIRKYVSNHSWLKSLTTQFGLDEIPNNVPVVLRKCTEEAPTGIKYYTRWMSLDEESIPGVDSNMNQVYPVETGEPPMALIKFLQEKNVTIR